ncbi:hypothetical protein [Pseudonocardia sp. TRM90224]|uniref:hypothetical protein n=1 Tax=Pseudonocardia sp. TRM90224 TaxID=2812678 RepID=UPI001E38237C|nr:hypothetical protein [Pseudonocardia sp. TRM90224]
MSERVAYLAIRGFGALSLAVGIASLIMFPAQWSNVTAGSSAPVCTSTSLAEEACLRHVPGRIAETRGGGWKIRHHFVPIHTSEQDAWVHLPDDDVQPVPAATRELISGVDVTALYWKDDPVAFETSHGRVVPDGADLHSRTNFLWGGLIGVCLGGIAWFTPNTDRRRKADMPPPRWLVIANRTFLVGLLAGGGTIFATNEQAKLITFGVVGTAVGLLVTARASAASSAK